MDSSLSPSPPLQGYKRRNAYIATQGPLQNTVGDFWRMMWEFKSKVMVMLCNLNEEGQEACHPYWPEEEGGSGRYGKIMVTLQAEASYGDFCTRKFFIHDEKVAPDGPPSVSFPWTAFPSLSPSLSLSLQANQSDGFVVTQFHHTEWPERGRPDSTGSLVEMLDMITKAQMNSGNRAITVMCK